MFCTQCGAKLEENDRFCSQCGSKVEFPKMNISNEPVTLNDGKTIFVEMAGDSEKESDKPVETLSEYSAGYEEKVQEEQNMDFLIGKDFMEGIDFSDSSTEEKKNQTQKTQKHTGDLITGLIACSAVGIIIAVVLVFKLYQIPINYIKEAIASSVEDNNKTPSEVNNNGIVHIETSPEPTMTVNVTATPEAAATSTPEPTFTPVPTPTFTPTPTPEPTPTSTPTPTKKATSTPTPTKKATSTPTPTRKPTSTPTPTKKPTSTPTPTKRATSTPTPTTDPATVVYTETYQAANCTYQYKMQNQKITLTGVTSITDGYLDIPDYIKGYPVVAIQDQAFKGNTYITFVSVPDTITSIGASAFEGCTKITGAYIFCEKLESLPERMFYNCTALETVYFSDNITTIGANCFKNCAKLATIELPSRLKTIGEEAFSGCKKLSYIEIPESATSIGKGAFMNCSSLENILLPESLSAISANMFKNCSRLVMETLPEKVSYIGESAFEGTILTEGEYILSDRVGYIGTRAFANTRMTEVYIHSLVSNVGTYAFADNANLTYAVFQASVKKLPDYIFSNCKALEDVELSSMITEIGKGAFYNTYAMKTFMIQDGVTAIGAKAFYNFGYNYRSSEPAAVYIPSSVKTIATDAFTKFSAFPLEIHTSGGSAAEAYAKKNGFEIYLDY